MAFVMLSIVEFCLETQPGFYIELIQNNSKCDWDVSTSKMVLVTPVPWVILAPGSGADCKLGLTHC